MKSDKVQTNHSKTQQHYRMSNEQWVQVPVAEKSIGGTKTEKVFCSTIISNRPIVLYAMQEESAEMQDIHNWPKQKYFTPQKVRFLLLLSFTFIGLVSVVFTCYALIAYGIVLPLFLYHIFTFLMRLYTSILLKMLRGIAGIWFFFRHPQVMIASWWRYFRGLPVKDPTETAVTPTTGALTVLTVSSGDNLQPLGVEAIILE